MQDIRKFICWIFAFSSWLYLLLFVRSILTTIHRHNAFLSLRNLLSVAFFLVVAVICGAAWRTIWKEQPSARGWGIAASVMHILIRSGELTSELQSLPHLVCRLTLAIITVRLPGTTSSCTADLR